jgi:ATP-binding cassette subfamily B protein AbcA/BmrA
VTGKASYRDLAAVLGSVRVDRLALGGAAALTLVEVAGSLGFPLLTRSIVDQAGTAPGAGVLALPAVWQLALVLFAAAVASATARYLTSRTGLAVGARLKNLAIARLLAAPVHYHDGLASGEVTSRVMSDTKAVAQLLSRESLNAVSATLLLGGAAIVLFSMDAALAGILFGVIGAAFLAMLPVMLTMAVVAQRTQDETAGLSGRLTQVFGEIRMVKTFGTEQRERRQADIGIGALFALGCRAARIEAALSPVMTLAVTFSLVTILAYGGMRVAAGTLSSGTLTAFLLYIFTVVGPLAQITSFFSALSSARGASVRLAEVLRLAPEGAGETAPRRPGERGAARALHFDGVRFGYGERSALALDGLVFAPGSRTAVIGPSGSGKSTLLALIERFYAPADGHIRYGDEDIAAIPLREWRGRIGYVAQTAAMLSGSVRDNLLYGIDRPIDEAEIAMALRRSRADGFVAVLPQGLETQIGERGARLSGGERQRLAIARMFLRDPEILLLDEATSSLDEENAHLVLQGLDALMRGRTCILVTHRMTGLEAMDQIVALDGGKLVERGTPEALLSGAGLYRRLAHRQYLEEKSA